MNYEGSVEETGAESAMDDASQAMSGMYDEGGVAALSELLDQGVDSVRLEESDRLGSDAEAVEEYGEDAPINKGLKGRLLAAEKKGEKRALARISALEQERTQWQNEKADYERRLGQPAEREESGSEPMQERAEELMAQAQFIQKIGGPDVLSIFSGDPEVRRRVATGEWDFADVANAYGEGKSRRSVVPPMRSSNTGAMHALDIRHMSESDLDKMNEFLARGGRIDVNR